MNMSVKHFSKGENTLHNQFFLCPFIGRLGHYCFTFVGFSVQNLTVKLNISLYLCERQTQCFQFNPFPNKP